MLLEGMTAEGIESREPELLALACKHMPKLCVNKLDVLLLDETGKNISGTGMDTNVCIRAHHACWTLCRGMMMMRHDAGGAYI